MSRFVIKKDNTTFVYGYDHAIGYFYEIWKPENEDTPLIEKSTLFEKLASEELVNQLKNYNAATLHILKVKMKLPL